MLKNSFKTTLFLILISFLLTANKTLSQGKKSDLDISDPVRGSVWIVGKDVQITWTVQNIAASKSIRFFLVRNEMVVQELGSFKNTGVAKGIALAKNIGSGDQYQVVGIELFPEDKFQIAKHVTPLFSISNPASDARKKLQEQKQQELAQQDVPNKKEKRKQRKRRRNKKNKRNKDATSPIAVETVAQNTNDGQQPNTVAKPAVRETFEGRKISYTKELTFDSPNLVIKIWDHGRQDGDIVSIYLNGSSIVTKHNLTYVKRAFKVILDPTKSNDLFLFAHNLGNSPPNTVSVEISDASKSENIILNSDLQSCEAVMISVNK